MGLEVPQLDDRTFDDLLTEARSLIPAVAPDWTDHNAADPGIALLELFAWLAEMLIYRADQVPDAQRQAFLRLLNGPAWTPAGPALDDDVARTIARLRDEWRAVTAADFERHAVAASADVLRARAIAGLDLSSADAGQRAQPRPAHLSLLLLLAAGADPGAAAQAVAQYLAPRRLVTTRVVVTEPLWTPVSVGVLIARPPDVPAAQAEGAAASAVAAFLDARTGGPDGAGWAWGRAVYASEVTAALAALPEVDHVVDLTLASRCAQGAARCVPAAPQFSDDGRLVGLRLDAANLPGPAPAAVTVASGDDFVAARTTVAITTASTDTPAVFAAVRRAVGDLTWPGHWPPAGGPTLRADAIAAAAHGVPGVDHVGTVTLDADAAHLGRTPQGIAYVTAGSRELIELAVEVTAE